MRLRTRPYPLLFLLLPSLAFASSSTSQAEHGDTRAVGAASSAAESLVAGAALPLKAKYEVGTKDAPVDGKDGKPHEGPFVDTSDRGRKKPDGADVDDTKKALPALKNRPADPTLVDGKKIPESNDGVMDDPNRQPPKQGTTGTEGGVSEKDKARKAKEGQTGEKVENFPETPKEAPPLPHSEQEKITSEKDAKGEKSKEKSNYEVDGTGLEKPVDLPGKLHDKPNPIPVSANKDHLDISKPSKSSKNLAEEEGNEGIIRPLHSFMLSLTMILFSEIGDKTFLVAALMAMKHDRMVVFSAAFGALFVMTVLSAVLGHTVPTLLPKRFTAFAAAGLFLIFGAKMLREGLAMSPDEGVSAEMQEVEMELEEKEHEARKLARRRSDLSPYALEMGLSRKSRSKSRFPTPPRSPSTSPARSPSPRNASLGNFATGLSNLFSFLLSPAWVQTFIMTFLGEWGDRSQIATIAMAAGQDYWWVTLGAVLGHACCTTVAVIGGRAIAGKVSMRVVTIGGAVAFLVFAFIYFVEAFYA